MTENPVAARRGLADIQPCGACPVRELAVCGVLEPDELYALAEIVHELRRASRQSVIVESDEADSFFIVTSGVASIEKLLADGRRQIVGFLYPSDFFGLAIDGRYAYNVTAVTNLSLCRFERPRYLALIARFPKLEHRLLGMASDELAASQEQMLVLGRKTAKEKVASFLSMLSERSYRQGHVPSPIWVPMTRGDIGDYLGVTTETTSRMFTQLRKEGLVEFLPDAMIDLLDRDRLKKIADGG
jgi:CRP/FNR family transcriptional regulator, anaerobic regulatory protein